MFFVRHSTVSRTATDSAHALERFLDDSLFDRCLTGV